jgi:hypothetical protein
MNGSASISCIRAASCWAELSINEPKHAGADNSHTKGSPRHEWRGEHI